MQRKVSVKSVLTRSTLVNGAKSVGAVYDHFRILAACKAVSHVICWTDRDTAARIEPLSLKEGVSYSCALAKLVRGLRARV